MSSKAKKLMTAILCIVIAVLVPMSASAKSYNEIEIPNSIGYAITSFIGGLFNGILRRNIIEYVDVRGEYISQSQSIKVYSDSASIEEVYFFLKQPVGTANLDDAVSPTSGTLYCVVVLDDGHVSSAQKTQIHSHKWTVESEVPATCTESGTRKVVCKVCGDENTVTIPATGHSFTNYTFNNDATETYNGTETAVCDKCSKVTNTRDYNPFTYEVRNYNGRNVAAYLECDETAHLIIPGQIDGYPVLITDEIFRNRTDIETLYIDKGVLGIGDYAFAGCTNLKSVSIADGITYIGEGAFEDCTSLENINIPDSVTRMGDAVCERCTSLKTVEIGHGITEIPAETFLYCTSLENISIPEQINYICPQAFDQCKNLSDVETGHLITSVGFYAFRECAISEAVITDGTKNIGAGAFENCRNITSVSIPSTVEFIGLHAFAGCQQLAAITVSDENPYFDNRDNCNAIIETDTNKLVTGCQNTVIPDSVTSIGEWAFFNCQALTSITIPKSVTSIGGNAFYCCNKLTDVYYKGTTEEKGNIAIDNSNEYLENATWYVIDYATINISVTQNGIYVGSVPAWPIDGDTFTFADAKNIVKGTLGYDTTYAEYSGVSLPITVVAGETYNITIDIESLTDTYIVTANGGVFSDGSTTKTIEVPVGATIDEIYAAVPEEPTQKGYTFAGWTLGDAIGAEGAKYAVVALWVIDDDKDTTDTEKSKATVIIYVYDDDHQSLTDYVSKEVISIDEGSSYSIDDVYAAVGYTSDNAAIRSGRAISSAVAGQEYTFIVDI